MKYPHNYQSQRGATFVAMLTLVGLLGLATGGAMLATGDMILDTARGGDESMHASHLGRQRDVHSGGGESRRLADEVPSTPSRAVGGPWDDPTETVVPVLQADSRTTPVFIIDSDATADDTLSYLDGTKPVLPAPTFVGTSSTDDIQAYLDSLESITTLDYHAIVRRDLGNSSELFSILHPGTPSWDSDAARGSLEPPPLQQRDHEIMEVGGEVIHFVAERMRGLHCVSTPGSAGGFACIEEPEPNFSYDGESFLRLALAHDLIVRCKAYGTRDTCSSHGELEERRKDEVREFIASGELIDGRFGEGPLEFIRGTINTIARGVAPILLPEDIIAREVALAEEAGGWSQYGINSVLQTPDMLMAMVAGLWDAPGQMLEACVVGAYQCGAATGPTLIDLAIGTKGTFAGARAIDTRTPPRTQLFDGEGKQAIIDRGAMDPDSVYAGVIDEQGNLLVRNTSSTPDLEVGLYPRSRTHAIIADEFPDDANLLGFTVFPLEDGRLMVRYKSASINERRRDYANPEITDPIERALINNRLEELTGREVLDGYNYAGMVDQDALIRGTWDERWMHLDSDLHTHIDTSMPHNSQIGIPKDMLDVRSRAELEIYLGTREGRWAIGEGTDGTVFLIRGNPTDLPGDVRLVYEKNPDLPLGGPWIDNSDVTKPLPITPILPRLELLVDYDNN